MNGIVNWLNIVGEALAQPALSLVVQSSVVFLSVLLIDRVIRFRVKAHIRYLLWLLVLVKFTLPIPWAAPYSLSERIGTLHKPEVSHPAEVNAIVTVWFGGEVEKATMGPVQPVGQPAVVSVASSSRISLQGGLFGAWCVVVAGLSGLVLQRHIKMWNIVRSAESFESGVLLSSILETPCVFGLFKPVVLVPHDLTDRFDTEELELIVRHERLHIRRADLWVQAWQTLLQVLFFFHPILWVANRRIAHLREMAVDETLAEASDISLSEYCTVLVQFAEYASGPRLLPGYPSMAGVPSLLHKRISNLLSSSRKRKLSTGVAVIFLLGLAYVLLPRGTTPAEATLPLPTSAEVQSAEVPAVPLFTLSEEVLAVGSDSPPPDNSIDESTLLNIRVEVRYFLIPTLKIAQFLEVVELLEDSRELTPEVFKTLGQLTKEADLLTSPRFTTPSGISSSMSITEEVIYPGGFKADTSRGFSLQPYNFHTGLTGITTSLTPSIEEYSSINPLPLMDYIDSPIRVDIHTEVSNLLHFKDFREQFEAHFPETDYKLNIQFPEFYSNELLQSIEVQHGELVLLGVTSMEKSLPGPERGLPGIDDRSLMVFMTAWILGEDGNPLKVK